jgi:large subunit ribosomal protein L28
VPRKCHFTGKKTRTGNTIARRGKAKYLGGVGVKTTGITRRKFKPNLQRVRAVIDGKPARVRVSTKAIRMGLVSKPLKRDWKPAPAEETATA